MNKGIIVHSLIMNRGKILILKRVKEDNLKDYWDFPGGKLEDGEQPAQGASREIREETGLRVKNLRLFFCRSNIDTRKNTQFITLIFFGEIESDPQRITLCRREHSEFKWIKLNESSDYQVVNFVRECVPYLKRHNYLIRRQNNKRLSRKPSQ